jgi:hypothetical protein
MKANLFLVGSAKGGTTSLYHYFLNSPVFYVSDSIKELNYMAFEDGLRPSYSGPGDTLNAAMMGIHNALDYDKIFSNGSDSIYRCDCSPSYMYFHETSSRRIFDYNPEAKIIAILRDPVRAAFSMYSMLRKANRETEEDFMKAFSLSPHRISLGWEFAWDYKRYFMYSEQIRSYLAIFPRENVLFMPFNLLVCDPVKFLTEIYSFLGIELSGKVSLPHANSSMDPDIPLKGARKNLRSFAGSIRRQVFSSGQNPDAFLRSMVGTQNSVKPLTWSEYWLIRNCFFENDICAVEEILGWSPSHWLNEPEA